MQKLSLMVIAGVVARLDLLLVKCREL